MNKHVNVALMVRIEAKPEYADAVAKLLTEGRAAVMEEPGTPYWFAVRIGPTTFGIFDAFGSDTERTAHLQGRLAAALLAKAGEVLVTPPVIERVDILASKV